MLPVIVASARLLRTRFTKFIYGYVTRYDRAGLLEFLAEKGAMLNTLEVVLLAI
jgi:hypothetical protein